MKEQLTYISSKIFKKWLENIEGLNKKYEKNEKNNCNNTNAQ